MTRRDRRSGARDGSSRTGVATVLANNECSRARSLLVGGSTFRTYACPAEKETGKRERHVAYLTYDIGHVKKKKTKEKEATFAIVRTAIVRFVDRRNLQGRSTSLRIIVREKEKESCLEWIGISRISQLKEPRIIVDSHRRKLFCELKSTQGLASAIRRNVLLASRFKIEISHVFVNHAFHESPKQNCQGKDVGEEAREICTACEKIYNPRGFVGVT